MIKALLMIGYIAQVTLSGPATLSGPTRATGAALAFVNSAVGDTSSSGTSLSSAPQNHLSGNLIVVVASATGTVGDTVSTLTDTAGNTYHQCPSAYASNPFGGFSDIWYAANITGNVSNVVTVTLTSASAYRGLVVLQYTGKTFTTCEVGASGEGTESTCTTGSFSPAASGNINVLAGDPSTGGSWLSVSSGYGFRTNAGAASNLQTADLIGASSGAQSAAITFSALSQPACSVGSFK
jgi:hypothetical protein